METWKDIMGHEGFYQVSDLGNVRSWINGKYGRRESPLIMAQSPMRKGYYGVTLGKNGKPKTYQVHVLIMKAFIGPRPGGMVCCHYDGNNQNNKLENLRWDTLDSNYKDSLRHGTFRIGENVPTAKFKNKEVWLIKKLLAHKISVKKICEIFKSRPGTIYSIKGGDNWKHITYVGGQ